MAKIRAEIAAYPLNRVAAAECRQPKRALHQPHRIEARRLDRDPCEPCVGHCARRIGVAVFCDPGHLANPKTAGFPGDHGIAETLEMMLIAQSSGCLQLRDCHVDQAAQSARRDGRTPPCAGREVRLPQIVAWLAQARVRAGCATGEVHRPGDGCAHALQWRFQRAHALAIAERDHQHACVTGVVHRGDQCPRRKSGCRAEHFPALEPDAVARTRHAQTVLRRIGDPECKQMARPGVVVGMRLLVGGSVPGDQMAGIDVRLHNASNRQVARPDPHQDDGNLIDRRTMSSLHGP